MFLLLISSLSSALLPILFHILEIQLVEDHYIDKVSAKLCKLSCKFCKLGAASVGVAEHERVDDFGLILLGNSVLDLAVEKGQQQSELDATAFGITNDYVFGLALLHYFDGGALQDRGVDEVAHRGDTLRKFLEDLTFQELLHRL